MTLPPTLDALTAHLGLLPSDLTEAERARASAALDDATALALAEVYGSVGAAWQIQAPPAVVATVLRAARREYENPQGLRSENVGEHSATVAVASGAYLTPAERRTIRRAAGYSGVGTIRTPSAYSPETL